MRTQLNHNNAQSKVFSLPNKHCDGHFLSCRMNTQFCRTPPHHVHAPIIPTSHFPSLYTVSPSHPRFFFHANFSASPTPILEEEPSSNTPIIHVVDVNFDVQQQYSKPEPENLNEFLCGLFEDPKTKELAFDYYQRLKERPEFRPEKPTLKHVISLGEVDVAEELVREAKGKTTIKDPEVYLKLVHMYIEEGLLEKTLEVVKEMEDADVKVSDCILCTVVNGFSKKRGFSAAVKVFEELISKGNEPGQVTYASVINAYWRLGQYSKAEEVFLEMEQKGFDKCVYAYSTMIVMYGRTGRVRSAMKLVAKMKERGCKPNVWIYNSLIDMHGRDKNLKQLEKLWKEMKRRRVAPDKDMKTEGTRLDQRLYQSAWNAFKDAGLQLQARWMKESFLVT